MATTQQIFPWALAGLSALSGGLTDRGSTTRGTSTQTNRITDPNILAIRDRALDEFRTTLSPGYVPAITANRLRETNRTGDLYRQGLEENLALSGIQGPARTTALASADANRFSEASRIRSEGPILEQEIKERALANLGNFIAQSPTQTESTVTSSQVSPGNATGSAIGNATNVLSYMNANGLLDFSNLKTAIASAGGNLAGLLGISGGVSPAVPGGFLGTGGAATSGSTIFGMGAATAVPVIGGIIGGALLAKKLIGRGREAADKLTGKGGLQNNFEETLRDIKSLGLPPEDEWQVAVGAYEELKKAAQERWGGVEGRDRLVLSQMFETISPLFGEDPLFEASRKDFKSML
jgi:hypothetical protein